MNPTEKRKLDIVLPCFNPPQNWEQELIAFHKEAEALFELSYIVVNDGSTNKETEPGVQRIRNDGITLTYIAYEENKGKGHALREGVRASKAEFILYTDIDFPFRNSSTIAVAKELFSERVDVVAGLRDARYYGNTMSGFRKVLSKTFRWMLKHLLRMPVTDTQCGLKAFGKKGRAVFLSTKVERYLFDFEFLYRCAGIPSLQVRPVLVELKPNVQFRKMKPVILVQEAFNLLRVLFSKSAIAPESY